MEWAEKKVLDGRLDKGQKLGERVSLRFLCSRQCQGHADLSL